MYEEAQKLIKDMPSDTDETEDIVLQMSLFDYLNVRDGMGLDYLTLHIPKGRHYGDEYAMDGGGTLTDAKISGGGTSYTVKFNGQNVMSFDSNGNILYTPNAMEKIAHKQISDIYDNACTSKHINSGANNYLNVSV